MKGYRILYFSLMLVFAVSYVSAIDTKDTKLLNQPAISKDHIAFVYAEDLWIGGKVYFRLKQLFLQRVLLRRM